MIKELLVALLAFSNGFTMGMASYAVTYLIFSEDFKLLVLSVLDSPPLLSILGIVAIFSFTSIAIIPPIMLFLATKVIRVVKTMRLYAVVFSIGMLVYIPIDAHLVHLRFLNTVALLGLSCAFHYYVYTKIKLGSYAPE